MRDSAVTNGPEINFGEKNNHQELWVYCQLKGKMEESHISATLEQCRF